MNKTIEYYEENAERYIEETVDANFSGVQNRFAAVLPQDAYVLDFGCGSGRDTKFFLKNGFRVDATDGSAKMCEIATKNVGIQVRQMMFSDLDEQEKYDGIWACSSILHLPKKDLISVFKKMLHAIKPGGCIYTSFKFGEFEGYGNGRYFTDFTSESFRREFGDFEGIDIIEEWLSADVRPGRGDEKWLNLILKKSGTV